MMKVLGYLLQEEDVTEDDFAIAISAALTDGDFTHALSWSDIGNMKFPNSLMLGPLAVRVARESGELDRAQNLLANMDEKSLLANPNFLLEKAKLFYDKKDYVSAKKLFEELKDMDGWTDLAYESDVYLARIKDLESPSEQKTGWW